ncbi:ribosomal protein S7 [Basidiobolus meristosporus CBS 931.73]|uniref:Ribosomal protein S7 n=1 Tax=Basidiobolus meristosporus CBS 931.73 TaxID=1314790 RepID=A0A1Y1Y1D2_9FUNG|nr:ribosomal protein S7 [Basidiobolus meristosporus CBS 931.73]|eukprot:ORX91822.1 ribosomal protein S7 [Basidiobolus meristosporus CBS 931.73]
MLSTSFLPTLRRSFANLSQTSATRSVGCGLVARLRYSTEVESVAGQKPVETPSVDASSVAQTDKITELDRSIMIKDPLLSHLVNTIMRDGKKAMAQRMVARALIDIRQKTNANPYEILTAAIDMASPLMICKSGKRGTKVVQVPKPLNERQRRRKAFVWLLEAAKKRPEKEFPLRLSAELLSIINGVSPILKQKEQLHKLVLANRANAAARF